MDPEPATAFYDGALRRIHYSIAVLTAIAVPALLILFGWKIALGFLLGAVLSLANFHSLGRAANAMVDRITRREDSDGSSARIVTHFLLRYVVIAAIAYGILSVSRAAFYGLVGGLFLPVAGVGCEAVFEMYAALRRGL